MEFIDSPHRNLLVLANCEIHLLNNDVKTAMDILKNVGPDDQCYEIAKIKLADIYLNKLKQPRAYTQCYLEILERALNRKNLQMLGDAYFDIQEYDEAVKQYN